MIVVIGGSDGMMELGCLSCQHVAVWIMPRVGSYQTPETGYALTNTRVSCYRQHEQMYH